MLQRILKNSRWLSVGLVLVMAAAVVPQPAFAYDFNENYKAIVIDPNTGKTYVCPSPNVGLATHGVVYRIISCVKETMLAAVNSFLLEFSDYMSKTIAAVITLAVALWGALMVTGKTTAPVRDLFLTAVKIGAVLLFTWNFGGLFEPIIDAMEWMLLLVTSYVDYSPSVPSCGSMPTVWHRIDCILQAILGGLMPMYGGVFPASETVRFGLAGFLVTCMFSGAVGLFIALMGFLMIGQLLFAVARAMYIFITAYMAFALMVLISPIFIPMILFRATRAYFEKWVKLTSGFILQPIFLFAYLAMLLAAFDTVVVSGDRSLYRAIVGSRMDNWTGYDPALIGAYLNGSGAYAEGSHGGFGVKVDYGRAGETLGIRRLESGPLDVIGEHKTIEEAWEGDIFEYLDPRKIFKVDAPTLTIDWPVLAYWANPDCVNGNAGNPDAGDTCVTDYLVKLFLSFVMALVTCFIFIAMLDFLPFVGSTMSGEALSVPTFGGLNPTTGMDLSPPGKKMLDGLKDQVAKRFQGGK